MSRKIILALIFLFSLLSLSCVCAMDVDNSTMESNLNQADDSELELSVENDEIVAKIQDEEVLSMDLGADNNTIAAKNSQKQEVSSAKPAVSSNSEDAAYLILDNDADKENIYIGDYVTWIIEVINLGPGVSKNVKVLDQLPDGLKYVNHTATKGIFDPKTGIWDIGDLLNGENALLYIKTLGISVGEQINKANLTSDTINLNNETYEEEEIDVLEYENDDIHYVVPAMKATGNPVFLVLVSLLACVICSFKRKIL